MNKLFAAAAFLFLSATMTSAQTPSQTSSMSPKTGGSMSSTTGPAAAPSGGAPRRNAGAAPNATAPDDSGDKAVQDEDRLIDSKVKSICVKC
jgi:hypothetical protein